MQSLISYLHQNNIPAAEYILAQVQKSHPRVTSLKTAKRILKKMYYSTDGVLMTAIFGKPSYLPTPNEHFSLNFLPVHSKRTERVSALANHIAEQAVHCPDPEREIEFLCKKMTGDIAEAAKQLIYKKMAEIFGASLKSGAWPYRMASPSPVRYTHGIHISVLSSPRAYCSALPYHSDNYKKIGNDSYASLGITPAAFKEFGMNLLIGGRITLDAKRIGPREYEATWLEQGRGYGVKLVTGFIIKWHHVTNMPLELARKKVEAMRSKTAMLLVSEREAFNPGKLHDVIVTREDSLRSGNCVHGTDNSIHNLKKILNGRESIPANELLALRNDAYTRRAVVAAQVRQNNQKRTSPV